MAKTLDGENCNVRIITQYKYSTKEGVAQKEKQRNFKISGEPGTVYRYEITPSIIAPKGSDHYLTLPKDTKIAGADYKMYAPENISSFIKYAVEKAPANQYLFFVTGHGDGYNLEADIPLTKTTASDENFEENPGISMYQIKEGIRQSGVQFALLGYQSCEMGQIEVISELQGAASYIMASGHTISDFGYGDMIEAMRDGDPFKTVLEDLARGSLNENLPQKGGNANFHITDMSKLPAFLATLKDITTYLCANKLDNEKAILPPPQRPISTTKRKTSSTYTTTCTSWAKKYTARTRTTSISWIRLKKRWMRPNPSTSTPWNAKGTTTTKT